MKFKINSSGERLLITRYSVYPILLCLLFAGCGEDNLGIVSYTDMQTLDMSSAVDSESPDSCEENTCSEVEHGNSECVLGSCEVTCDEGYLKQDNSCIDIDECAADNGGCGENSTCSNSDGSFACDCNDGFTMGDNGCEDVDKCATNNGGCGDALFYSCTNNQGAPVVCDDVDECAVDNGGCGDAQFNFCTNNDGAAPSCADIDECAVNNGGCGDPDFITCENNDGEAPTCNDIDECAVDNGGCGDPAFFSCTNNVGEEQSCEDVDECAVDNGGCGDPNACSCIKNEGDTPTCQDIDECSDEDNPVCGKVGECSNTDGGFECACPAGFTNNLDGACVDIDECENAQSVCDVNATYTNTPGGAECTCNEGYVGDGINCCPVSPDGGYSPCGPQTNISLNTVLNGGWTQCFDSLYNYGINSEEIPDACQGQDIMYACSAVNSSTLTVLAWAPREDVFRDTGSPGTLPNENTDISTISNGSHWYYGFSNRGGSMGFLRAGDRIRKNFYDPVTDEGPEYRICWHIGSFSGWRCGSTQDFNASQEWRRYVFVR